MNSNTVHENLDLSSIHHIGFPPRLPHLDIEKELLVDYTLLMEDTACTSNATDTFFVNSTADIISYSWTIPSGAVITSTLGDTMIVVNWNNATLGLSEICITSTNVCGEGNPTCLPIRVINCNQKPNAVDDRDTTPANLAIRVLVQQNDTDAENHSLTTNLDATNTPSNGTIILSGDDIIYTPNTNFTGTDDFSYYICDNGINTQCDTALVTIVVLNTAPNAVNDIANVSVGMSVNVPVQNNDSDPENHDLTTSLDPNNGSSKGQVVVSGDNIIYTPNQGSIGTDQFDYIICDDDTPILCDTATVTILINNQVPVAVNDIDTTLSNTHPMER